MANGDRISELYKREIWDERVQRVARARVDWVASQAEGSVLDVGCSQGITSILCARRGLTTLGVDVEADRIDYARADRAKEPRVVQELLEFRLGDGRRLDVPDGSIDTVLLGEVVEHLVDASPVLAEAVRVLRPDGRLVLTTPFGYHPHHDHRATFYVATLLDLVAPYVTVVSLDVVDGYFRGVFTPQPMGQAAKEDLVVGLQPLLEQEFRAVEEDLREQKVRSVGLVKELDAARKQAEGFARLEDRLNVLAAQQGTMITELQERNAEFQRQIADHQRLIAEQHEKAAGLQKELATAKERLREAQSRAAKLDGVSKSLREAQDKLAHQQYRTKYVTWQLESSQSRRWWRLGESLWQIKGSPTRIFSLPVGALRASVKLPMPQPPAPPAKRPRRAAAPSAPSSPAPAAQPASKMPHIPEVPLPAGPVARPNLTVAVIMDTFSSMAFRYEWRQVEPDPVGWRETMERERPSMLFVESSWQGHEGKWFKHVHGPTAPSAELRELVQWCQGRGIPTVFWNKEDPPNFDLFIESAKLFDWVFTVDADSVPRYHELLGHDRVGVLPFGAQPRIHNPVSVPGGRTHDVVFAGTYFTQKHPERRVQMDTVVAPATEFDLHIYSRVDTNNPRYAFPEPYARHIVGTLPYERMLAAYKAYKIFLNVNSVIDSPTMCARRIFELSACATPVVTAPSRAIEAMFPELVSIARTQDETREFLTGLLASRQLRDRQAHLAMREVFAKHTFGHRVDTVLETIGLPVTRVPRPVTVIVSSNRPDQIGHVIEQVARQTWRPLQLVLVLHGLDLEPDVVRDKAIAAGIDNVVVRSADASLDLGRCLNLAVDMADGELVAKMDDDDIYGAHYLNDLVTAFTYTDAGIVGKSAYYAHLEESGAVVLRRPHHEHNYVDLVSGATMVVERDLLSRLRYDEVARGEDTGLQRRAMADGVKIYSADRFSYVQVRRADKDSHTWRIADDEMMRTARLEFYGPPEETVIF